MEEFFNRTDKKYKIIMLCVIVCIIIVAYIGSQLHDDNHLIVGRWEEVGDCWMDELEFSVTVHIHRTKIIISAVIQSKMAE